MLRIPPTVHGPNGHGSLTRSSRWRTSCPEALLNKVRLRRARRAWRPARSLSTQITVQPRRSSSMAFRPEPQATSRIGRPAEASTNLDANLRTIGDDSNNAAAQRPVAVFRFVEVGLKPDRTANVTSAFNHGLQAL